MHLYIYLLFSFKKKKLLEFSAFVHVFVCSCVCAAASLSRLLDSPVSLHVRQGGRHHHHRLRIDFPLSLSPHTLGTLLLYSVFLFVVLAVLFPLPVGRVLDLPMPTPPPSHVRSFPMECIHTALRAITLVSYTHTRICCNRKGIMKRKEEAAVASVPRRKKAKAHPITNPS